MMISTSVGHPANTGFDLVGDVRDHLDRAAEVIPTAFLGDDRKVNAARGVVVLLGHNGMREPFVMTKIEIGFRTVIGDENLPMLKRIHGARVNIDVWVQAFEWSPAALCSPSEHRWKPRPDLYPETKEPHP